MQNQQDFNENDRDFRPLILEALLEGICDEDLHAEVDAGALGGTEARAEPSVDGDAAASTAG